MWTYQQSTGHLSHNGSLIGTGYSGHGADKNNPAEQAIHQTGPLPRGTYTIGAAATHPRLGPIAMRLAPDPSNEMFGRSDFYMHGDNLSHEASLGCIIQDRATRETVASSSDRRLEVIE